MNLRKQKDSVNQLTQNLKAVRTALDDSMLHAEVERERAIKRAQVGKHDCSLKWVEHNF